MRVLLAHHTSVWCVPPLDVCVLIFNSALSPLHCAHGCFLRSAVPATSACRAPPPNCAHDFPSPEPAGIYGVPCHVHPGHSRAFTPINPQNLVVYGELSVLGKDYRLSQHANSKARNKTPTVSSPRSKISGAAEHGLTMGCSSFGRERTSYGLTLTATLAIAPPHCCRALSLMTRFNGLSNLYCRLLAACLQPSRVAILNTARASCSCLLHKLRVCRGKCASS